MIGRLARSRQGLVTSALAVGTLLAVLVTPRQVLAHWGVCASDPKVWLDNGVKVEMETSVQADASIVSHITYTLHVPTGVGAIRTVYTQGLKSSTETVNVARDSGGGYWVDALATSSDGASYPVTLTILAISQNSTWSTANGFTNQDVLSFVPSP